MEENTGRALKDAAGQHQRPDTCAANDRLGQGTDDGSCQHVLSTTCIVGDTFVIHPVSWSGSSKPYLPRILNVGPVFMRHVTRWQ